MASAPVFQTGDTGSIPAACSTLGYRQAVRQQTLTLSFASSNLAIPTSRNLLHIAAIFAKQSALTDIV